MLEETAETVTVAKSHANCQIYQSVTVR